MSDAIATPNEAQSGDGPDTNIIPRNDHEQLEESQQETNIIKPITEPIVTEKPQEQQQPQHVPESVASQTTTSKPDNDKISSKASGEVNPHAKILEDKKKPEDDKLGIYKAFAIKLKKELVKTRDELQQLQVKYKKTVEDLKNKVETLETTLESERVTHTNTSATLEATLRNLKSQLEISEKDLQSLQDEFDNYKTRATKIMQQNNMSISNTTNKTFEEERQKQLKALCDEQKKQLKDLTLQMSTMSIENKKLEQQVQTLTDSLNASQVKIEGLKSLEDKYQKLCRDNEILNQILNKEKSKTDSPVKTESNQMVKEKSKRTHKNSTCQTEMDFPSYPTAQPPVDSDRSANLHDINTTQVSSRASVKDDNQTNSTSSIDSSASGYVHIKPTAFEIISRTSVLEDAQNQIDNLTKAYLDSESTNSLLTEQVCALKEEIRRIQRGNERMELANNLEYLKNVIFKFLSLEHNQVEQKQRLVPVLSTVLKLSPEEISKLNGLVTTEKGGMTSSFFKL